MVIACIFKSITFPLLIQMAFPRQKNKLFGLNNSNHFGLHIASSLSSSHNKEGNGLVTRRLSAASSHVILNNELFGRLPKCGRNYLIQRGDWQYCEKHDVDFKHYNDENHLFHFIWPNKSGPQFHDLSALQPALVRPFPTEITDILDDKLFLTRLLQGTKIMPKSITSAGEAEDDKLYFVKHRYGAQGKSVYAYNRDELIHWFNGKPHSKKSTKDDFLVQEEIPPVLDSQGRKFVLRSHLLLRYDQESSLQGFTHRDVLCLPHTLPYDRNNKAKAVHISQAGKNHPPPLLLEQLEDSHPAKNCFENILESCQVILQRFSGSAAAPRLDTCHPEVTLFALLGLDYVLNACTGEVQLCEINSHPALGWGSMKKVDYGVYQKMIEEMLAITVFNDDHLLSNFVPTPHI